MAEDKLLSCPNCSEQWFQEIQLGLFEKPTIDFKSKATAIERKLIYVCIKCGYGMDSHKPVIKMLVITTGDSEGYKRRLLRSLNLDPDLLNEKIWARTGNILFVARSLKDDEEKWSQQITPMLDGCLVDHFDASKDYDSNILADLYRTYATD